MKRSNPVRYPMREREESCAEEREKRREVTAAGPTFLP
jgi:hypothetical protein